MRIILFISFFCFSGLLLSQEYSFDHGGYERIYLVHLPAGYNPQNEYPLVVAFHGGLGKGSQLENQSLLSEKADQEGFIVVYPDGVPFGVLNIRTWNAGHCCGQSMLNNVDDVGFVEALIDTLQNNYPIETNKVYGTGMSNGAFLCYRIACEKPGLFSAIAPIAGTMAMESCPATELVPIIHFHSELDDNIPFDGGVGNGLSDQHNPPLDSVHVVWSQKGNCSEESFVQGTGYSMNLYSDCDCQNEIHFYLTEDGGHSWPGGTRSVGDEPSTIINANDLMWEFFSQYPKNCSVNTTELNEESKSIWPNPALNEVHFSFDDRKQIYDANGRLILSGEGKVVDVSKLDAGIYFVLSEEGIVIGKFLKVE